MSKKEVIEGTILWTEEGMLYLHTGKKGGVADGMAFGGLIPATAAGKHIRVTLEDIGDDQEPSQPPQPPQPEHRYAARLLEKGQRLV